MSSKAAADLLASRVCRISFDACAAGRPRRDDPLQERGLVVELALAHEVPRRLRDRQRADAVDQGRDRRPRGTSSARPRVPNHRSLDAPPARRREGPRGAERRRWPMVIANCCSEPERAAARRRARSRRCTRARSPRRCRCRGRRSPARTTGRAREKARPEPIDADDEQRRAQQHHLRATPAVGQAAGEPGADRTAQQCDGDDKARDRKGSARSASRCESTAPLITEVSKPKRKPPTAAAMEDSQRLALTARRFRSLCPCRP